MLRPRWGRGGARSVISLANPAAGDGPAVTTCSKEEGKCTSSATCTCDAAHGYRRVEHARTGQQPCFYCTNQAHQLVDSPGTGGGAGRARARARGGAGAADTDGRLATLQGIIDAKTSTEAKLLTELEGTHPPFMCFYYL